VIQCEEALQRLWEFLDGELQPKDEAEVRRHLEMCSRCYPRYDFQRAYFELMDRLKGRDSVPNGLRRQLFERILAEDAINGSGGGGSTS
jgi:mycothiol system anti-sigma-R factor